jgi:hypothetical protein
MAILLVQETSFICLPLAAEMGLEVPVHPKDLR